MNVKLKKWEEKDAESLSMTLSNQNILKNLRDGLPYPYTRDDALDYIRFINDSDHNKYYVFAITVNDLVIGNISVERQENIHYRTGELGYYIDEKYWGKGIMSEAVRLICEYVFSHSDIIRIFAEPFSYNIASCKVLEKNGFVCEGILRKNAIKGGQILDMKLYALIKEEKDES